MPASSQPTCGLWMPRAKTTCARGVGHGGPCASAKKMENYRRLRRKRVRVVTPEQKAMWARTSALKRYGLTRETFAHLLADQGHACAMCHEPFQVGQSINIDHDHNLGCHPGEKEACNKCRRGLLCLRCNTGLGYYERMSDMCRDYLRTVSGLRLV